MLKYELQPFVLEQDQRLVQSVACKTETEEEDQTNILVWVFEHTKINNEDATKMLMAKQTTEMCFSIRLVALTVTITYCW